MNLIYSGLSAETVSGLVTSVSGITTILFFVVTMLFGCYGLYGVYRLKRDQYLIPHRLMYPNYCSGEDCLDPVEYMDFIMPRLTIVSVAMVIAGPALVAILVIDAIRSIDTIRSVVAMLVLYMVPLVTYLWYSICLKRAAKKYWE